MGIEKQLLTEILDIHYHGRKSLPGDRILRMLYLHIKRELKIYKDKYELSVAATKPNMKTILRTCCDIINFGPTWYRIMGLYTYYALLCDMSDVDEIYLLQAANQIIDFLNSEMMTQFVQRNGSYYNFALTCNALEKRRETSRLLYAVHYAILYAHVGYHCLTSQWDKALVWSTVIVLNHLFDMNRKNKKSIMQ